MNGNVCDFSQAISLAVESKIKSLATYASGKSVKQDKSRLVSFIKKHYKTVLGLSGSIEAYITGLKESGLSASYIRRMRGLLKGFMAYMPVCQLEAFTDIKRNKSKKQPKPKPVKMNMPHVHQLEMFGGVL